MTSRHIAAVLQAFAGAALAAGIALPAAAQAAFPNKPVKIIVPYTPGTSADMIARLISNDLGNELGQAIVVENKAGAASIIGTAFVAKAPADGYTVMMALNTHVITPASRKTPYDPIADFATIGQIATGQMMVLVNPSVPATTFSQLVDYLRKQGDAATYSTPGVGSTTHLYSLVLQDAMGTRMRHIPANGMNVAAMDVMQNQSTLLIGSLEATRPHVASGKLKALAQTGKVASPLFANVPTVAQSGHPEIDLSIWVGMYAPAGTPRPIVERLNTALRKVAGSAAIRDNLAEKGYHVMLTSPEDFAALNKREFALWSQVIQKHNLRSNESGARRPARLPHEHDESADSQVDRAPADQERARKGHDDVERGVVDTDKGPVIDQAYKKVRGG
jgi:tripartite-type tricarboxylate transporter receptor subunit TctC